MVAIDEIHRSIRSMGKDLKSQDLFDDLSRGFLIDRKPKSSNVKNQIFEMIEFLVSNVGNGGGSISFPYSIENRPFDDLSVLTLFS